MSRVSWAENSNLKNQTHVYKKVSKEIANGSLNLWMEWDRSEKWYALEKGLEPPKT